MTLICGISDLRVHAVQDNGDWLWVAVRASIYYRVLQASLVSPREQIVLGEEWEHYQELLKQYSPHTAGNELSLGEFLGLAEKVDEEGFDVRLAPITIDCGHPLHVLNGQHRLSILFNNYAEKLTLRFEDSLLDSIIING